MTKSVQNRWTDRELPGIDCLLKSDGSVVILNCYCSEQDNNISHYAIPLCETTIHSLEKYDNDIWSEIQSFISKQDTISGEIYYAGEGAMGNEGFIACCNSDEQLKWALFFCHSNPFYELELSKDKILAYSSYDLKYEIDRFSPEYIKISKHEIR